jgi:hypothetical protein
MGVCQADPVVTNYCNEAQDRLLLDPMCPDTGWWGGWIRMNLAMSIANGAGYVTTPQEICRLIVMSICQQPVHIRNGFYEYLEYGNGLQPKSCSSTCTNTFQAYERDNVVTLRDFLTTPQIIRIYPTDGRDTGLRVLIQGKDQNGMEVLTTDPGTGGSAPGEYVQLAFPFVDTTNTWSSISGIQKDETYGPLTFVQVDPTTLVETALSSMEPREGTAWYRRYLVAGIPSANMCCSTCNTTQIVAQGKLDFVPVKNETDYLTIPCVPALIEECMAIRFSRMDSTAAATQALVHHGRALAYLNGQLDKFEGKWSTAIKVPIFGSDRLTRQPV